MLSLEIEWLMGVAFLARDPSDPEPDWPPQPDRVYSALAASWGAHEQDPDERAALEWLEEQAPPSVAAAKATPRDSVTVFVPPNDGAGRIEVLPERRRRQPRQFPAARLPDAMPAHLRLTWAEPPEPAILDRLAMLARDTSYLGHSSSLVRCRFTIGPGALDGLKPHPTRRVAYPGRLAELKELFDRHQAGDERARPKRNAGPRTTPAPDPKAAPQSVFASRWTVLAHVGGDRPDILATAGVARRLRDALMRCWPEQPPPEWLSGHAADGSPSEKPHLAVVPLADVGHAWSDGRLMGLGLILPRELEERWDDRTPQAWRDKRALASALTFLAELASDQARSSGGQPPPEGAIRLELGPAGVWLLAADESRDKASLRPERYARPARRFATVTPIALDRHPRSEGPARLAEAADIIAGSCERIGLPRPARVAAFKHAALRGAPSAWPAGGGPSWRNWARPKALNGRPLVHAVIEFVELVQGPVILGAGRFFGLGLCLPLSDDKA